MDKNMDQSLLALMLALEDVPTDLTDSDYQALADVGEQLKVNPGAWEVQIAPRLQAAILGNPDLAATFQAYESQLAKLQGKLSADWLPKLSEIDAVVPQQSKVLVSRGFPPGPIDAVKDSKEINNIAVRVLSTIKPEETVKKSGAFQRLKNGLRQSLG